MANEKIIAQKEKEVNELAEKIKAAKIVLLADYRGITVDSVTGLRADLRKANTEYKVIKNNITRRALAKCEYAGLDEALEGPTAVVMNNEDYLDTAKTIYELTKNESKIGILCPNDGVSKRLIKTLGVSTE
jgi:large subunit ribosomal protein L10